MKITMLTTDFLPNIGGVAQHIYELARAMAAMGDEVEVIAPMVSSSWSDLNKSAWLEAMDNFKVWRIPFCLNRSVKFFTGRISGRLSKQRFTREAVARLAATQPDVLHWHALDTVGYPAESFRGTRVWTNHTSNFIDGIPDPGARARYRREASSADHVLCPSEELAELTISIGVPQDRVHFISNGVDSQRFNPSNEGGEWRKRLGLDEDDFLILCPRRLEKKNGVLYFIQAAIVLLEQKDNARMHFAVAGNFTGPKADSDEEAVTTAISDSGTKNNIHLLGRVENAVIPGLYAAANLVVMPSLIEATSLSAMEAMSTGKAIVSTNVGGLPFLIRNGENGILVPPRNPQALADAINKLVNDSALRQKMGAAGRERVEQELDWRQIVLATKAFYKAVPSRRS